VRKSLITIIIISVAVVLFGLVTGYTIIRSHTDNKINSPVAHINIYVAPDLLTQDTSCNHIIRKPTTEPEVIFHSMARIYSDVDRADLLALSVALYTEARGEPWVGIAAVSDVIRNRVHSSMFPNTYYNVATQPRQFSGVINRNNLLRNITIANHSERNKFIKIIGLAYRTIDGDLKHMTSNALFYHASNVKPFWASHYHKLGDIGHHVFYTTTKL